LFNLRDLSKIFQGISLVNPSSFHTLNDFTRCVVHEINRIFRDRLNDLNDQNEFDKLINEYITPISTNKTYILNTDK